ncbi:MAG TPA: glycosyltransferase family 2 protein [Acetobacteraceae bacterium]|nr:glycosyltransferase family 2 protein [Acetobacteraceae bacterium]
MFELIAGAADAPAGPYDADVVILALDRAEETVAAIRSALQQAGVTRHVFVVDQGSRPETLARLAEEVAGRPDATLVSLGQNYGVAGGRNRGSALGHGRVIVGLDNDAEFATPDTLAHLVAAVEAEPDIGAVGCRIVAFATGADDLSSWGYPRRLLRHAGESFEAATFVGAGHAIRRHAWDAAGGYDEALFFCWEELDFCRRAAAQGWRVRYRGDIVIRHKVSAEQRVAWSGNRWFWFVRNRVYVGRKHGASWLSLLPRCAVYLLRATRDGALRQAVRGMAAAVVTSPAQRGRGGTHVEAPRRAG